MLLGKAGERTTTDNYGALVGWTIQDWGSSFVLEMQSVTARPPNSPEDVDSAFFMLTKTQAIQLGHNLFQAAGQTVLPQRKRSWLKRFIQT